MLTLLLDGQASVLSYSEENPLISKKLSLTSLIHSNNNFHFSTLLTVR